MDTPPPWAFMVEHLPGCAFFAGGETIHHARRMPRLRNFLYSSSKALVRGERMLAERQERRGKNHLRDHPGVELFSRWRRCIGEAAPTTHREHLSRPKDTFFMPGTARARTLPDSLPCLRPSVDFCPAWRSAACIDQSTGRRQDARAAGNLGLPILAGYRDLGDWQCAGPDSRLRRGGSLPNTGDAVKKTCTEAQ